MQNSVRFRNFEDWATAGLVSAIAIAIVYQPVNVLVLQGLKRLATSVPATLKPTKSEANAGVFSGNPITKAGMKIGTCTVTDYRRYREVHPVPGVPPRWHNGIDLACPGGTHEVYSPVAGTVRILQPAQSGGGGLVARIQTDDGWTIQNMHMLEIVAKPGKIFAGEKLGTGGAPKNHPNAGLGTGPHSHYERFEVVDGKRRYVTPTDTELKALLGQINDIKGVKSEDP